MTLVYFDVTDVVKYATRNNTVVGIPRVQLNIISLLARKYGGDAIRCAFYDFNSQRMFEFDPSQREAGFEFDGGRLLSDLGLTSNSTIFPSKSEIKSFLRLYNNNKVLRTWKKLDVYWSSMFARRRLLKMGFRPKSSTSSKPIAVTPLDVLPEKSRYVCLGAVWLVPEIWQFAQAHKDRGGEVVQMVYDLIPLTYPEYYTPREPPLFIAWLNKSLDYATRFICISEWTAKDLRKYASDRGKTPPIRAVPLAHEFVGFDRTTLVPCPAQLSELSAQRFVLCVGTIEYRKNNLVMLKIWQELLREGMSNLPLLVFAGKYGKGGAEFQSALSADHALAKFVRVIHAPSDTDLAWLYQNCAFTAYPSQFEGWGLPVGEAAWFGKYTVASNVTSIPEVCGDLIDYVDPHDVSSIKNGLVKAIEDHEYLRQREVRIMASKLRTWDQVADDVFSFAVDG